MSLSDDAQTRVTPQSIRAVQERQRAAEQIDAGRLPTLDELYQGLGFAGGDWKHDLALWCADLNLDPQMTEYEDAIRHARATCSRQALEVLRDALTHEHGIDLERVDLYLTAAGDPAAHARTVLAILADPDRPDPSRVAFGLALARHISAVRDPDQITRGKAVIRMSKGELDVMDAAEHHVRTGREVKSAEEDLHERMAELETAIREDRGEIETREPKPAVEGIVVVPKLPPATGFKVTIAKTWADHAGKPLPLVRVGDIPAALKTVIAEMPHCRELAIQLAMQLHAGMPFYLRPRLFVGEPGSGKSTFARVFTGAFGVPSEMHNLAGAADSSIGGTSAQFNSARESSFLQQIKREGIANPVAILDELEKSSPSRHNGSALDAILPLLERHTARRYRDPALEVEVDLSGVTAIATANSLEGIPPALKDRFVIHQMPVPEWQHVGALSRSILNKIAEERGLHRGWFPDLAGDELEVIRKVWPGGSIRRLEKAVRILVDGRDKYLGRA